METTETPNEAVTVTAIPSGTIGNAFKYAQVIAGTSTPLSVVTTYTASTGAPIITLNAETDDADAVVTTAAEAAAAVNADPVARQYVTASYSGTGADEVVAGSATALSGGSNGTGTPQKFYTKGQQIVLAS